MTKDSATNRRNFLTRGFSADAGNHQPNASASSYNHIADDTARIIPTAGDTVRLGARAMACDFTVILNPGPNSRIEPASESLNLVGEIEEQLSVYRDSSEVSQLNRHAARMPVPVKPDLFDLLDRSRELSVELNGAFDPTAGPLLRLWRRCQDEHRLPTPEEIAAARSVVGMHHVHLDNQNLTVAFDCDGVELNFGANGKGYAVDRAGEVMSDAGVADWLIHGGHSSILAHGTHAGHAGWPIGLKSPLFPRETWATILLCGQAMATSGSGVQFYRIQGKRYNHIVDPRIGWPVEGQLSVTVFAPTAELADTLSTAFFVMGVEKGREYCGNHPEIGAILTPPPELGRTLKPILCNIPPENIFFHQDIEQTS